jgi:hypothetical protein
MLGLMTVARHERLVQHLQTLHADLLDAGNGRFCVLERCEKCREVDPAGRQWAVVPSHHPAEKDAESWRFLATKLAADLADLQRRYAPMPIPDDLAPGEGSVGDGDAEWTPTALAAKAKAVR